MSKITLRALCVLVAAGILGGFWSKLHQRNPPSVNHPRRDEKQIQQILKQGSILGIALLKYQEHHDQRLPPVRNWEAEILPYLPDKNFSFVLPGSTGSKPRRWVLERTVAGHKLEDLRSPLWERVIFFEAQTSQGSPSDTLELVAKNANEEGFVVVYASRLAEYIPASRSSTFLLQNERPLVTP